MPAEKGVVIMRRMIPQDGRFCAYLRKSRDERDEHGLPMSEEETLRRHRDWLVELSKRHGIRVSKWYSEVASGETIADRPMVQQVLSELADKKWDGVLCVDVQRLARSDTKEQGIMCEYLEVSDAFVITLDGTFDTNDEADMDYLEYGLFNARREYKQINKIMARGRERSRSEGNYICSKAPLGYDKVRVGKYPTLVPNEYADKVVMAFELVADGKSFGYVAKRFDELNVPYDGFGWTHTGIGKIIRNELYKGVIVYNKTKMAKTLSKDSSKPEKKRVHLPESEWRRIKGKHEAIVTDELWERANKAPRRASVKKSVSIAFPFAGIVRCKGCGRSLSMSTDKYGIPRVFHPPTKSCRAKSCRVDVLTDLIVDELKRCIDDCDVIIGGASASESADMAELKQLNKGIDGVEKSLEKLLRKLLDDVVDDESYRAMKAKLMDEKASMEKRISEIESVERSTDMYEQRKVSLHAAIELIRSEATPEETNKFMRTFVAKIEYQNLGKGFNEHDIRLKIDFL